MLGAYPPLLPSSPSPRRPGAAWLRAYISPSPHISLWPTCPGGGRVPGLYLPGPPYLPYSPPAGRGRRVLRPISPHISPYLPISPHLPGGAACARPISPHISPQSPYISPPAGRGAVLGQYLPISPHISPYLPTCRAGRRVSSLYLPYLPISPTISPPAGRGGVCSGLYLPTSPYLLYLPTCRAGGVCSNPYLPISPHISLYLPTCRPGGACARSCRRSRPPRAPGIGRYSEI